MCSSLGETLTFEFSVHSTVWVFEKLLNFSCEVCFPNKGGPSHSAWLQQGSLRQTGKMRDSEGFSPLRNSLFLTISSRLNAFGIRN